MKKFLVIQTGFIGDVVLATGILEKLHQHYPEVAIDMLVRKGNESLFAGHPFLHEVLVWNKEEKKNGNLFRMLRLIRSRLYDKVINVHRFTSTGILTAFSGAKEKIGFDKNPLSVLFTTRIAHRVNEGGEALHETERNHELIKHFTDNIAAKPKLYPRSEDEKKIATYLGYRFITVSPASVWFSKEYPKEKWISFLQKISHEFKIYLLGASSDAGLCEDIRKAISNQQAENLCGKLTYLQSAALMKKAKMNYVNDSAPMHFASAVNAPVTAVYCSTVPGFGFGPLSDVSYIAEIKVQLPCRPCGIHGKKQCPLHHFRCALSIADEQLLETLPS